MNRWTWEVQKFLDECYECTITFIRSTQSDRIEVSFQFFSIIFFLNLVLNLQVLASSSPLLAHPHSATSNLGQSWYWLYHHPYSQVLLQIYTVLDMSTGMDYKIKSGDAAGALKIEPIQRASFLYVAYY
ncbi:uncharacterized protein LOC126622159 [Malus sylvestris]|uniref:uncharacterized protein LOC126622159 n=1 Tax=Malus sylvestris TaxID=3752 RepID=UPI0021AD4B5A|nr:uncharacterized protein LOC126622159 [Malus sylvestris]